MTDASTKHALPIPVNAWTAMAVITALFQVKAAGDNPHDFHVNLL